MQRGVIARVIFFFVIALLMLAELFMSNLGTLLGDVTSTSAMMGITPDAERTRLWILILLDAVAGLGALVAAIGLLRKNAAWQRYGALATAIGLVLYGAYQFFAALFQLNDSVRIPVMVVGVVYALIGVAAWWLGARIPAAHAPAPSNGR